MEENNKKTEYIDLVQVFKKVMSRKALFIKVWVVTFILACVWVFPQPRSYMSTAVMAPEFSGDNAMGGLSSLASSFGFNMGNMESSDAFYPELYPDVISTNDFVATLLAMKVTTQATDNEPALESTYLEHITKYEKKNLLTYPFNWTKKRIKELFSGKGKGIGKQIDPTKLSKEEETIFKKVKANVTCSVDKKTNVITITVWDQDAQVACTLADSVCRSLQNFITDYRTHKSRIDLEYYKKLMDDANKEYIQAKNRYGAYCDAHQNMTLQSFIAERSVMENTLSQKLTTYNAMSAQYEAAKAKVQERTPAFTTLDRPRVANKAERPKRMIFVIAMLFLATLATIGWIFKNEVTEQLKQMK